MKNISVDVTKEQVAVITIDCKNSKVNKVSRALLDEIAAMVEKINPAEVRGLVIVSGKEDNFVVGADIDEVIAMKSDRETRTYISRANDSMILHDIFFIYRSSSPYFVCPWVAMVIESNLYACEEPRMFETR